MVTSKQAAAGFTPKRQRSQYTCMSSSLSMALESCGIIADEDTVNKVMGAAPMQGASWEQAFAAAQHFGARVTFICPMTLAQVKSYTDRGVAVMIAWNPEGRPWSHASVVKDVDDDGNVTIADPNIPDPDVLTRTVSKAEFYGKWYEKLDSYLVRRPAMAVEREITVDGKQRVAKTLNVKVDPPRNPYERERGTRNWGGGSHGTRTKDVAEGRSRKEKHKKDWSEKDATMNRIVANVALRHFQASQFELARAFADQVGMPDRMSLAQLHKILAQAFSKLICQPITDWEWWGYEPFKATKEVSKYLGYGEVDSARGEDEFDVPDGASTTIFAKIPIKELARTLSYMKVPTKFFQHKRREIMGFLMSHENKTSINKFLAQNPIDLREFDYDNATVEGVVYLFEDGDWVSVDPPPRAEIDTTGDMECKFDGVYLNCRQHVTFKLDYTEVIALVSDDYEEEHGLRRPGPEYDDPYGNYY